MSNLSSYSREELSDALRILKSYRTSLKQIGSRAKILDIKQEKIRDFRIEHTSSIDKDFLEKYTNAACDKFFPEAEKNTAKNFVVNENLIGGIRIFYGDDMIDLSFQDASQIFLSSL